MGLIKKNILMSLLLGANSFVYLLAYEEQWYLNVIKSFRSLSVERV